KADLDLLCFRPGGYRMILSDNKLLCAILIGGLLIGTAFGQAQDGNLVGSIFDQTGAAVADATVEAENIATGIKITTTTDATGAYRFKNLLIGTYKVTTMAAGLSKGTREVVIELNKTTTANISLNVGAVVQEISVTDTPALIDTTTPHITNNFTTQMISDLPLAANPVSGGIYNLSLGAAGVTSSGGIGVGVGPSVGG